jgi:hypothetical protein
MKWFYLFVTLLIFQVAHAQDEDSPENLLFINTNENILPVRSNLNSTNENDFIFYSGMHLLLIEQKYRI